MDRALILSAVFLTCVSASGQVLDLDRIEPDLAVPHAGEGIAAPGRRVKEFLPEFEGTGIYHLLYLPTDWKEGGRYPVIFEYAGNQYKTSPGTMEGCELGYGLCGGTGAIWVCLPFVDPQTKTHARTWWGDADATAAYAVKAVDHICAEYGGKHDALVLAGFSRGAIACNYIGLRNDKIAPLWAAFFCHSHYDGVKKWPYADSDRESAIVRLRRLGDRPQFISHERSVDATREFVEGVLPDRNFTFLPLPFPEHTARWMLRDIPERAQAREWFWKAVAK